MWNSKPRSFLDKEKGGSEVDFASYEKSNAPRQEEKMG